MELVSNLLVNISEFHINWVMSTVVTIEIKYLKMSARLETDLCI